MIKYLFYGTRTITTPSASMLLSKWIKHKTCHFGKKYFQFFFGKARSFLQGNSRSRHHHTLISRDMSVETNR